MRTANLPRQQAYRLVALQIAAGGIITLCWGLTGWVAALSALLGSVAVVLPSFYFAFRFFAATFARQVKQIIRAFYWGELTKLILTAFLVILISKLWPKMAILPFFSGFTVACLGFWLAPLLMKKR